MFVWFLKWVIDFQNLSVWFLKEVFWFPEFARLISKIIFFLISKICPFDFSNEFLIFKICLFDFLNEISVFETCPSISHDFLISKISLFEFLNECLIFKMSPFPRPILLTGSTSTAKILARITHYKWACSQAISQMALLIFKMRRLANQHVTGNRRWSVLLVCCQTTIGMAERDREGVFRGSCINHPPHRFGASEKFVLMKGTSKCPPNLWLCRTFPRNKNGVGRLLLHVFVRRALSRSFDQFCFLCFCSGLSLEDFYLVTEMSRCNLGVTFF